MEITFHQENRKMSGIKIIAVDEGKFVGRGFIYFIENDLHKQPYALMEDVFVNPEYRSQGIGTKIIKQLIDEAKSRGCYKFIFTSRYENEKAHSLYERLGFKKHGAEFRMDL